MSRVDFYILPESDPDRQKFACALVQKAWKAGNRVCLLADDRDQAGRLDDLLWTFRDISFVPHALADSADAEGVPILISWDTSPTADVLVNIGDRLPSTTDKFDRIAEIVGGDEGQRQAARKRYREYRQQGHELHNHTIEQT